MLNLSAATRVFLAVEPVDLRGSFNVTVLPAPFVTAAAVSVGRRGKFRKKRWPESSGQERGRTLPIAS